MTTSEPDPRTDLAGWLGLTETQANICRRDARSGYADVRGILGARLVAQDQADTPDPEPDDGPRAMLDIDALGGAKHLREVMCVAQTAVGNFYTPSATPSGTMETLQAICDVCDQHRPLGPDGKHGTRRCTPTCGCIDKRDPEPDDGLIAVTVWLTAQEVAGEGEGWDTAVDKLCEACAAIDLPAPKPPWTSPLDDLPDLTEQQCRDAVRIAGEGPDSPVMWAQVGRALIAAGWTPEGEA